LALTPGTTYYGCVRAVDGSGNMSSAVCSDGAVLQTDTFLPTISTPRDGMSGEIDAQFSTTELDMNFDVGSDLGTGISGYEACASTAVNAAGCTGTIVAAWQPSNCAFFCWSAITKSFTGLTLTGGTTYYVCLRATDTATNVSAPMCSDGVTVQADSVAPPPPAIVRDGTDGTDTDASSTPGTLSASWTAVTDSVSGLGSYSYCFSTAVVAGGCSGTIVQNWMTTTGTSASASGLSLVAGTRYYVCVRATDVAANTSATASCSDGVVFGADSTPPPAPVTIWDGPTSGSDGAATSSLTDLSANWPAVADPASGLARYEYCVSTATICAGTVVRSWTSNGTATTVSATGLTLVAATTYYVCVRAVDLAGNTGTATCSNGQVGTASGAGVPAPAWVIDGFTTDVDATFTKGGINGSWAAVTPANGLRSYQYCVSTTTPCAGTVMVDWTNAETCFFGCTPITNMSQPYVPFTAGTTYYVCVRVYDQVWQVSTPACSDGVLAINDVTAPSPPAAVDDGLGADIDAQVSTTQLSANWPGGTDTQSTSVSYEYCMSSATGCAGTIVVNWAPTIANQITRTKTLVSGNTYFTCVRAVDEAGNRSTNRCSDGVVANPDVTAPPAPALVTDGPTVDDVDLIDARSPITGRWSAVEDPGSGLSGYEYCVSSGTGCTGTQLTGWTNTSTTSLSSGPIVTVVGATYYLCVRALDRNGNRSTGTCSDGVTVQADVTAPQPPAAVSDGDGADIDAYAYAGIASANWSYVIENGMFLTSEWCLSTGTGCTGTIVVPWTGLSGYYIAPTSASTTQPLTIGTTYYACVRTIDLAGNRSANACSDGQTPGASDTTPPSPPSYVDDGLSSDIDTVQSTNAMAANWPAASDAGSGIRSYITCLSSQPQCGGQVLQTWTTIGANTSTQWTAVTPVAGVTYYACVTSVDGAGNRSTSATCSDGQQLLADATAPPAPAYVYDGYYVDNDFQTSWSSLLASWPIVDPAAAGGVAAYESCFATAVNASGCTGTILVSWIDVSASCYGICINSASNAPLVAGTTYYSCVRTRDLAGNRSAAVCSDGITVDRVPPTAPTPVNDGTGADVDASYVINRFTANWGASTDDHAVARYDYCITTATSCGGQVLRPWTTNGTSTTLTDLGVTLTAGTTYFICVRAVDGAGSMSAATCSDGVLAQSDTTAPPAPATVNDGPGADTAWTASNSQVDANWTAVVDAQSGLDRYEFCVSTTTSCGGTIVQDWTGAATNSMSTTGLTLVGATTYFVCVRAVDNASNVSGTTCSNGQALDTTAPPQPASANDGTAADVQWTTSTTQLSANWAAVVDAQTGLNRYEYCISSTTGCAGTILVSWTSSATTASVTATGLSFSAGSTWFTCARAVDNAGNTGTARCTNGQTSDPSVAAPASANDGVAADVATTTSTTQLSANWGAVADAGGSGLLRYEYCMSTAATCAGTVVRTWTSSGATASVTATGLTLVAGTTYYTCIRALDVAGNVSSATCTNGQQVVPSVTVTGASPGSAPQGRQGLVVQVSGTGFVSGASVAVSGAGIAVQSVTFVSATRVDVTLNIAGTTALGAHDVTVTNPDLSTATGTGALTITAPGISLTMTTLGFADAARDATVPLDLNFGVITPGVPRMIGPTGSGQTLAGAAASVDVTSDTDYVVQVQSANWSDGVHSMPASTLEWRPFGSASAWTAMTTSAATMQGATAPGTATYAQDWRLSVPAAQASGAYSTVVTYTVVTAA
jgi:hypothetical protein